MLLVVLTQRHRAGMPEAPGARLCGREQANRDGQALIMSETRGLVPDPRGAAPSPSVKMLGPMLGLTKLPNEEAPPVSRGPSFWATQASCAVQQPFHPSTVVVRVRMIPGWITAQYAKDNR
jgi:hypothetical protein